MAVVITTGQEGAKMRFRRIVLGAQRVFQLDAGLPVHDCSDALKLRGADEGFNYFGGQMLRPNFGYVGAGCFEYSRPGEGCINADARSPIDTINADGRHWCWFCRVCFYL